MSGSCNEGIDKYDGSWGPTKKGHQNLTSDTVKATGPGAAGKTGTDKKHAGGMSGWTGKKDHGANKGKIFNPGAGGKAKKEHNDEAPEQSKLER